MRGLRRHHGWSLVPAILWVAVQIVMAGAVVQPVTAASDPASPLGAIVICTPQGMVELAADVTTAVGADTEPDGAVDHSGCRWCQAFAHVVTPGRAGGLVPGLLLPGEITLASEHGAAAPTHDAADADRIRAPPV